VDGLNSDWTKQVRPIGTVKALMIFVDFPDAPASAANPNQGGRTRPSTSRSGS
jgi:hypothetical protein